MRSRWPANSTRCPTRTRRRPRDVRGPVNDPDAAPFLAIADDELAGFIGFRCRRRLNHATFRAGSAHLLVSRPVRGRDVGRPRCLRRRDRRVEAARRPPGRARGRTASAPRRASLYDGGSSTRGSTSRSPRAPRGRISRQRASRSPADRHDDADFDAAARLLTNSSAGAERGARLPALRRTYAQRVAGPDSGSMLASLDGRQSASSASSSGARCAAAPQA